MSADEHGCRKAQEYLRLCISSYSDITFHGYLAMGRTYAREHYKLETTRQSFMEGWRAWGMKFVHSFKPEEVS